MLRRSPLKWKAPFETVSLVSNAADELLSFLNSDSIKRPIKMKLNKFQREVDGSIPDSIPDYQVMDKTLNILMSYSSVVLMLMLKIQDITHQ